MPYLRLLLALLATSAPLAARAQPSRMVPPTYLVRVEQVSPYSNRHDIVLIMRLGAGKDAFWLAERWAVRLAAHSAAATSHDWADGRTCPALTRTIESIGRLPPLQFAPAPTHAFSFHQFDVRLRGPAAKRPPSYGGGELIVTGLGGWWAKAEDDLQACWTPKPPLLGVQPAPPHINSDADADGFRSQLPD